MGWLSDAWDSWSGKAEEMGKMLWDTGGDILEGIYDHSGAKTLLKNAENYITSDHRADRYDALHDVDRQHENAYNSLTTRQQRSFDAEMERWREENPETTKAVGGADPEFDALHSAPSFDEVEEYNEGVNRAMKYTNKQTKRRTIKLRQWEEKGGVQAETQGEDKTILDIKGEKSFEEVEGTATGKYTSENFNSLKITGGIN